MSNGQIVASRLSEDRLSLTIIVQYPEGKYTSIFSWKEPATDEQVQKALAGMATAKRPTNAKHHIWRRKIGSFTVYIHTMSGPPTWFAPRFLIRDRALIFGWLRLGYAVAVRRG